MKLGTFTKQLNDRLERMVLTLVAKKYLFCAIMLWLWAWKVAPGGWAEILGFVAVVIGIAEYFKPKELETGNVGRSSMAAQGNSGYQPARNSNTRADSSSEGADEQIVSSEGRDNNLGD